MIKGHLKDLSKEDRKKAIKERLSYVFRDFKIWLVAGLLVFGIISAGVLIKIIFPGEY